MKKTILTIIGFLFLGVFSCSDEFTENPRINVEDLETFFLEEDNVEAAVIGIYDLMQYNYGRNWSSVFLVKLLPGDDANADTGFRKDRDFHFSNTINELALGIEFNFYEYDLSSDDKTATPYLLFEMAAFNYKSARPNRIPGEDYDIINKTSYAIPFGIGYKSKLYGTLAFAVEAKFRYTFEDDIDSEIYDNTDNIPTTINANLQGTGNDWYMFTGVSLIYTFGRPACYTNGL